MRLKNYYIINIEGLDVSGKETFSKSLKDMLEKMIVKTEPELEMEVYQHSFPTYESRIGKKIKAMLQLAPSERDGSKLDSLFAADRRETLAEYQYKFRREQDRFHILIVDRYYLSNLLYSTAALIKNGDVGAQLNPMTSKAMIVYRSERLTLPIPDKVVVFSRGYKKRENYELVRKLHNSLILSKGDKDANETDDFQTLVNDIYWKAFRYNIDEFVSCINVTIGENFGNTMFETVVIDSVKTAYERWLDERGKSNE